MERIEVRANLAPTIALGFLALCVVPGIIFVPELGAKIVFTLLLIGIAALAYCLGKRKLWVDENGVTSKNVFGEKHIAWPEIEHYSFWSMDQQAMAAGAAATQGGLIGIAVAAVVIGIVNSRRKNAAPNFNRAFTMGRLKIVAQDGRTIAIDSRYRRAAPVLEFAFGALHARLRASAHRNYAPFAVAEQQLAHIKKGTIAYAEIEKITVTGARLVIKKRDKRLAWARVPMRDVRNSLLFLEDLAEHGVSVAPNNGMYMPPSVLQKLLAAASRQAALPQARVVQR